ncbi:MAG: hypothetical protein U0Y82_12270 [Thermoleophilia bacterium]
MPYTPGIQQAATPDAARIAQAVLVRDAQTQTIAAAGVRTDVQKARRIPRATAAQRQRGHTAHDGTETERTDRPSARRDDGERHLDLRA